MKNTKVIKSREPDQLPIFIKNQIGAQPTGFEPVIFPVTGGRVNRATPRLHKIEITITQASLF